MLERAKAASMHRRGMFCSSCLGCLGALALLIFVGWLMTPKRATLPPVPADVEFAVTSGRRELLVSRSRQMAVLVEGPITYLHDLAGKPSDKYGNSQQEAWVLHTDQLTYVHMSPGRVQRLGPSLGGRLRDLWLQEAGERGRLIWDLVGPAQEAIPGPFQRGSSKISLRGTWEGQNALILTYAYRASAGTGLGAMIPGPWRYYSRGYVPGLGFNLAGSESEAAEFSSEWGGLKVGPLDPARLAVPAGYREKWSDAELQASTPKLPSPPAGYRAIGGTDVNELRGGITEVRTTWMQEPSPQGRYSCALYVYFLPPGQRPETFLETPEVKWLGFRGWDAKPLAPDRTARPKPERLLLSRKHVLARLELNWYDPRKSGQRQPPPGTTTEVVLELLARHLSVGL